MQTDCIECLKAEAKIGQHHYHHADHDPMTRGQDDMRGRINVEGIEEAARIVADAWAAPFDANAHARLQGIIRAAYEAGQLDGITNKTERVY